MVEAPEQTRFLVLRLGSVLGAVPLTSVLEVMRPLPVSPLEGVPGFVRGVSVIRGIPTPVVDLAALVTGSILPNPSRFATLRVSGRQVALSVEGIPGIRTLKESETRGLPPLLQEASQEVVQSLATLDSELLLVLKQSRLFSEELWPKVENRGDTP